MTKTADKWTGGLSPEHELVFPGQPDDPDMREGVSIWLFEDKGRFAIPRLSLEAEPASWDERAFLANFAFPDGRVLQAAGKGLAPSPFGPDGAPSVFGAGPATFRMIEPFRTWTVSFDGMAIDAHVSNQITGTIDPDRRVPLKYEIELAMAAPCFVQDFSPETVAKMTPEDAGHAASMGIGWKLEQAFRAKGVLSLEGVTRDFTASGLRIKRQSRRQLASFGGHVWQSAIFPDGRAFGFIAYPGRDGEAAAFRAGYVYQNGRLYPATPTKIPWLRRLVDKDDDVAFELESELGVVRIAGTTALTTFRVVAPEVVPGGLSLHQGGALYSWGDQTAYGMIERSARGDQTRIG